MAPGSSRQSVRDAAGAAIAAGEPWGLLAIPAFNEEASIAATLDELRRFWPTAHTVVVDDGSSDRTSSIVGSRGVACLVHATNLGYGPALQTAMMFAAERGYPYVLFMDADGQHDPESVTALIDPIRRGEADLVVGSRFVHGRRVPASAGRRLAMFAFSVLTAPLIRGRVRDTSSGFKAIHGRLIAELRRAQFVAFHSEILVYLALRGYRILEVPTNMRPRRHGTSMHNWSSVFTYPLQTILAVVVGAIEAVRQRFALKGHQTP